MGGFGILGNDGSTLGQVGSNLVAELLSSVLPLPKEQVAALLSQRIFRPGFMGMPWGDLAVNNRGNVGAYDFYQNSLLAQRANAVFRNVQTDYNYIRYSQYLRATTDYADWTPESGQAKSPAAYEEYIRNATTNNMSLFGRNTLVGWIGNAIGWDEAPTVASNMRTATANLLSRQRLGIDPSANEEAAFVAENLLRGNRWNDEKNEFEWEQFDSSQWAGFSASGVSSLFSRLSKSADFGNGTAKKPEDLFKATTHARDVMKGYLEALQPLQEVMGDQTDKMVDMLEKLTNQSIGQIGRIRARSLSNDLAAMMTSGAYTFDDVMTMNDRVKTRLGGMSNLHSWNYLSHDRQALAALDTYSGYAPADRTSDQWKTAALENITSTYNSKASDYLARYFVLWAQQNQANGETNAEAFARFRQAAQSAGGNMIVAARRLAGNPTANESTAVWGDDRYKQAILEGWSGDMAMEGRTDRSIDKMARRARRISGYKNMLSQAAGTRLSGEAISDVFKDSMWQLENNPDLIGMPESERIEALKSAGMDADRAFLVSQSINYISTDNKMALAKDLAVGRASARKNKLFRENREKRNDRLRELTSDFFTAEGGWAQFIPKDGDILGNIKKKLSQYKLAVGIGNADSDDGSDKDLALALAGLVEERGTGVPAEELAALATYTNSAEGKNNQTFQDALKAYSESSEAYKKSRKAEDAEKAAIARRTMLVASKLPNSNALLSMFMTSVTDDGTRSARLKAILEDEAATGTQHVDLAEGLKRDIFNAELGKTKNAGMSKLFSDFIDSGKNRDINGDTKVGTFEGFSDFYKEKKAAAIKSGDEATLKLLDAMKKLIDSIEGAGGGKDWQTMLIEVLQELAGYVKQLIDRPTPTNKKPYQGTGTDTDKPKEGKN